VDEDHGGVETALQLAKEGEQGGDLPAGVLVHTVQPDEGVEDEQARMQGGDGVDEADPVILQVEPQGGGGDDVDVEGREVDAGVETDPVEAAADDVQGVLGGKEEDGALVGDGETGKAGRARSDSNGELEGQDRLTAFRFPADYADGLGGPEVPDKPALLLWHDLQVGGAACG
jgi:hypothetical protein